MSCIPIQDFSLISLCDATKAGKLYSIVPDSGAGDFDVTRASTATYLGSDGLLKTAANNEPRIEFNPDGSYKGLLVEPAATNLVLRSEEFESGPWSEPSGGKVTDNFSTSPKGTQNAALLEREDLNSFNARVRQTINVSSGTTYTLSVFLKNINAVQTNIAFRLTTGASTLNRIGFNWSDKTIVGAGGSFVEYPNDWVRLILTFESDGTEGTLEIDVDREDDSNGQQILIWGAQLETGSVATSYIPTVASTVTRAADVINKTGASALIGQTRGVIQLQADLLTNDLNQTIAELYDDTDNYINIRKNNSNEIVATLVVAGSTVGTVTSAVQTSGKKDITFSYQTGTCTLTINGVDTTATATDVPATDKIKIGARQNDTEFWNSHVQVTALRPQL